MAKTFTEQLEELEKQAKEKIVLLINTSGEKSDFLSEHCLKITNDDLMFNLQGGRYLKEITREHLVDNKGYLYNYNVLPIDNFLEVVDYLLKKEIGLAK